MEAESFLRQASASRREEIPYTVAISLAPKPRSCGKMNQIQCPRFCPLRSSAQTSSYTGFCTSTKRWRSKGSDARFWRADEPLKRRRRHGRHTITCECDAPV